MFSVEHVSSMGPAVMEEGGEEQQASYLVAKQAVEFPQVLASYNRLDWYRLVEAQLKWYFDILVIP